MFISKVQVDMDGNFGNHHFHVPWINQMFNYKKKKISLCKSAFVGQADLWWSPPLTARCEAHWSLSPSCFWLLG